MLSQSGSVENALDRLALTDKLIVVWFTFYHFYCMLFLTVCITVFYQDVLFIILTLITVCLCLFHLCH